jgi:hypothetical protein
MHLQPDQKKVCELRKSRINTAIARSYPLCIRQYNTTHIKILFHFLKQSRVTYFSYKKNAGRVEWWTRWEIETEIA